VVDILAEKALEAEASFATIIFAMIWSDGSADIHVQL
jgi:hypothetical protein